MEFIKSIYAGVLISLASYIYLNCENKYVGAFLFSIGLLAVFLFEYNLYTGKVCLISSWKKPSILSDAIMGNLFGTAISAFIFLTNAEVIETAVLLVQGKLSKPLYRTFTDAVLCGVCIAIAVKSYRRKILLGVVLGVMAFLVGGGEHVVADMFYVIYACTGDIAQNIIFILIVLLGNTVGGLIFLMKG